ncbi:MAG: 3-hydroxyacyl-CoA dehydrogenase/enoyl-CoA hydratase family protein [Pseudomonadota bacterium]
MLRIKQVCVIGAGVMGSGIAAQIANSGIKVLLLDVASQEIDRSSIAKSAIAKMQTIKPAPLSHPSRSELITPGNLEDDLHKIEDCQLLIEAIVEKLDIKHALYKKLLPYLKSDTILASNTSTLPLTQLKTIFPQDIAANFIIIHFFNPPRYMKLVELVTDSTTTQSIVDEIQYFLSHRLGKSVVQCNDTPGFIANRVGCFLLELVLRKAIEHKLDIDIVDHIFSKCLFFPSTGIFGLYDLIGLDVMGLISDSLVSALDKTDRFVAIYKPLPQVQKMIREKYTGRKGLGGFYRVTNIENAKVKEVMDLASMTYRPLQESLEDFGAISDVLGRGDNISLAFKEILEEFGAYITSLIPSVTDNIYDLDLAMKLGYSWKYGPFELFYKFLPSIIKTSVPIDGAKFITNTSVLHSTKSRILSQNSSTILREFEGGAEEGLCLSFVSKVNCLNHDIFNLIILAVSSSEKLQKPLYIYSDTPHFSAGADLKIFLSAIENKDWEGVEAFLLLGQRAMQAVKYSKMPVIAAASGATLGGGCELLLHSHFVVANQQITAGLVEVGIGLIPGWGGLKEMVLRSKGDKDLLLHNLKNIIMQNRTTSADYLASDYLVDLRVNMNADYLLKEAMSSMPLPLRDLNEKIDIPEFALEEALDMSSIDAHTKGIISMLQKLSGRSMTEDDLLLFEREVFMSLIKTPVAEEKIRKILK